MHCASCGAEWPNEDAETCIQCGSISLAIDFSDLSKAPTDEMMRLLGIKELRIGRHNLKGRSDVWVRRFWYAKIMPSFDDWALVGLSEFKKSKYTGLNHPYRMKAAVVTFKERSDVPLISESAELTSDPLRDAVRAIDLMPEQRGMWLDGICYEISIYGSGYSISLDISNPTRPGLVAVQTALLKVCERVQQATNNADLNTFLKATRIYLE